MIYLSDAEIDALLAASAITTWISYRDHALPILAIQTGLCLPEPIGLRRLDLHLSARTHVACHGKERKERSTPFTRQTVAALQSGSPN